MQDIREDVVNRAVHGDVDAFEEIVRAYGDLVFNVSLRMLKHRQDAEEVVQEVFLTVHRKLKSFAGQSKLKTWIYRITVNAAINYSRRTGRMRDRTVEYDEEALDPDHTRAVPDAADKEYAEHIIRHLLGLLSAEQRACVVLRSIEGLSYEQIAEALKIDVNSVRSRLKRARDKMLAAREEVMRYEL